MGDSRFQGVKAYSNQAFLNSVEARSLRILAEYMEPRARFRELKIKDTIVIFGSSRTLPRDVAEERLAKAKAEGGDVTRAEKDLHMSRYYEETRKDQKIDRQGRN